MPLQNARALLKLPALVAGARFFLRSSTYWYTCCSRRGKAARSLALHHLTYSIIALSLTWRVPFFLRAKISSNTFSPDSSNICPAAHWSPASWMTTIHPAMSFVLSSASACCQALRSLSRGLNPLLTKTSAGILSSSFGSTISSSTIRAAFIALRLGISITSGALPKTRPAKPLSQGIFRQSGMWGLSFNFSLSPIPPSTGLTTFAACSPERSTVACLFRITPSTCCKSRCSVATSGPSSPFQTASNSLWYSSSKTSVGLPMSTSSLAPLSMATSFCRISWIFPTRGSRLSNSLVTGSSSTDKSTTVPRFVPPFLGLSSSLEISMAAMVNKNTKGGHELVPKWHG